MGGGVLPSPLRLSQEEEQAVHLLGGNLAEVRQSLNALNGSLVLRTIQSGTNVWRFKHPTVRDAFAALIAEDSELLDIYLAGTPPNKLLSEISCGEVGIRGAKVVVPMDRYDALIARLDKLDTKQSEQRDRLYRFLSYRCDRAFLEAYVTRNPCFIDSLSEYSYLSAVPDVSVILRLHKFDLLPEHNRKHVVEIIEELAVETPDTGFLSEEYRSLFKQEEFDSVLRAVREKLLPNPDTVIDNWRWNYRHSDGDADGYFASLSEALEGYRKVFAAEPEAITAIDEALQEIEEVITELRSEGEREPDDDFYDRSAHRGSRSDSRSIFDNVDE
jgi:hypothetical protein